MKKSELEKHLGCYVIIYINNGNDYCGYLYQTQDEKFKDKLEFYLKKNSYVLMLGNRSSSCVFKLSHITKIIGTGIKEKGDI